MFHSQRPSSSLLENDKGSILVTVIWILVFFSILSVAVSRMVLTQIELSRRVEAWVLSAPLIRSVCFVIRQEKANRIEPYASLKDLLPERTQDYGIGRAVFSMVDEESKININTSSEAVLKRVPGLTQEMAKSILRSTARPFLAKEELLQIDDFNRDAFDACKDLITTYSNGSVNVNTAPVAVLTALGIDEPLARSIDNFRKGPDGKDGTGDDGLFDQAKDIGNVLKHSFSISDVQRDQLLDLVGQGLLVINSENFTLNATTFILDRKANMYDIVLGKNTILRWQER